MKRSILMPACALKADSHVSGIVIAEVKQFLIAFLEDAAAAFQFYRSHF